MAVVCRVAQGRGSRGASCGLLAAAVLVGTSAGCSGLREQSPERRLAREYAPPATRPVVTAPAVEREAFTASQLEGLPTGVQAAFAREHPTAAVTKVTTAASGSGPMMYRISFLDGGSAGTGTYTSGGADAAVATEAVAYRPDDSGRPKAKYAPKAEGGIPAQGTPRGSVD